MSAVAEPLTVWAGRPLDALRQDWGAPAVHAFASVPSTNDVARECAERGAAEYTIVVAEAQTAGRGRRGRSWQAPRGTAVLCSVLLRPVITDPSIAPDATTGAATSDSAGASGAETRPAGAVEAAHPATPLRVGVAVARAIQQTAGIGALLKWPNDLLGPDGRKVGGILCEAVHTRTGRAVIVGIGLNIAQREEDWPPELRGHAAALEEFSGRKIDRAQLVGAILDELRRARASHGRPLDADELAEWFARDALRDRLVRIDDRVEGIACGITSDGALLMRGSVGPIAFWTGSVHVVNNATRGRTASGTV